METAAAMQMPRSSPTSSSARDHLGVAARARSATRSRRRGGLAARALDADPARDGLLARERLEAAATAAAALVAVERPHRDVADLAREAVGPREDRAVDDHGAADADAAVDQEPVAHAPQRPALELAERREVGVVAHLDRERRIAERVTQLPATGTSSQPRFGAWISVPVCASTVPGTEMPAPTGVRPRASHSASASTASSASASNTTSASCRGCRARPPRGSARRRAGRRRRRRGSRR